MGELVAEAVLDAGLKDQLRQYFQYLRSPVTLEATLDRSENSVLMRELLTGIAELSDKVSFREDGSAERAPSFKIRRDGSDVEVAFAGLPLGHEFTSLVLALLQVSGHPPKISEEDADRIRKLAGNYDFQVYFSQSCHNCPDVVQALNAMSVLNPRIRVISIDGAFFPDEVARRDIRSVPQVFLNGENFSTGRSDLTQILNKLDAEGAAMAARKLSGEAPFDVLVLGAGPAGVAASVYAARKGIRTGIVAERFGGQVMDTAGIENFISVMETEGTKLGADLEAHVRSYEVSVVPSTRAVELETGSGKDAVHEVKLANGAVLKAKSVILATGAHWRTLGVPGEEEYRTKGVAYCPHCDGPFFKGQPVAVAGGGNSGVEAAIDLAGICSHVSLLQFDDALTADEVLQERLLSLPNVTVLTQAQTTEVLGDGAKMNGLKYKHRKTGEEHRLDVHAVFVQIGLLPNTKWLEGSGVKLSPRGEIVINERNQTSVAGVFGAGDATTVPYKQIVVAIGEGAKASLSAFDYLIRGSN